MGKPKPKRRGSGKDRKAPGGEASVLSPEWRRWAADNLLRGVEKAAVVHALRSQGVPAREAERRIEEIVSSPVYAAATAHARRARQLETILSLQRRVARHAPEPTGVERVEGLSADAFFARYYATSTPVILPDLVPTWPAAGWTLATFRDRFGDARVKITDGRDADPDYDMHAAARTREVPMRELVDRIEATDTSNDFYMVAQNRNLEDPALEGIFDDLRFDRGILDPARRAGCTALWLGPAGTVTPLHHDTANILFCQIRGEKRVKLISPLESRLVADATAMYAGVDPEAPDLARHPFFGDVLVREVVLGPGDALFIPVGWWHHVRALSASISLAFVGFARDVNDYDWYRPGTVP